MGASPKSARLEQPMQVMQGTRRDAGCSERHCGTYAGVEHPLREYRYDARFDLDMHDASASALLAIMGSNTLAEKGMPRIVNYNFSPDMGQSNHRRCYRERPPVLARRNGPRQWHRTARLPLATICRTSQGRRRRSLRITPTLEHNARQREHQITPGHRCHHRLPSASASSGRRKYVMLPSAWSRPDCNAS